MLGVYKECKGECLVRRSGLRQMQCPYRGRGIYRGGRSAADLVVLKFVKYLLQFFDFYSVDEPLM